ncbi:hypothetical protein CROQUDRAFT_482783 [Cronartium quercuum f. sp. fusiforme G11]|uniref:Uncharacterized protein n=1 Tax=Cronartium quercuum f. sp. fusiforme G11 TaxID=708437 RepID=A0A9P6NN07_9BASI|nr:hypothetical protein CROQUDRAFT_482783 [Cronartium quercuum f. sp. fusiforme G11]
MQLLTNPGQGTAGICRLTSLRDQKRPDQPTQEHHPAPKKARPALPIWRGKTGRTLAWRGDANAPSAEHPVDPSILLFLLFPAFLLIFFSLSARPDRSNVVFVSI